MRCRLRRSSTPTVLAALAAGGAGLTLALVGVGSPAAGRAAGEPWQPVLAGLYGDRVVDVVLTGSPPDVYRSMLLLPFERGLFVAHDDGSGWDAVQADPDRPAAAVHAVALAGDDEEGLAAYAGLQGRTRFARSDDGGRTWLARVGPAGLDRVDRLASARGSGRIYAAQHDRSSLYTSLDKGDGWAVLSLPGSSGEARDLFSAPDDPYVYLVRGETLYATNDDPGGFSVVLGPNPTPPVTVSLRVDLAAVGPRGRLHAAGRAANGTYQVLSSDDRGATWTAPGWPIDAAGVPPTALGAGEVRPGLSGVWLAVEDGRVFESGDRGLTWELVARMPITASHVVVDPYNHDVWVGTNGLGLFRVKPEPQVHTGAVPVDVLAVEATGHAAGEPLRILARVLPERRDLTGTEPPVYGLFESVEGAVWTREVLTTELGTTLMASPAVVHDRTLYSGSRLSRDAGATWFDLPDGPGGEPPTVVSVGPLTGTLPVVYALETPYTGGATGGGLLLSEDGGVTWQETEAPVQGIVDVVASPSFETDRTALLATAGGFIHRSDDGVTFEPVGRVPSYDPIERNVQDLALSPEFLNDGTALAAVEDPLASPRANVYVSNNRGSTWQPRTAGLDGTSRPRHVSVSPGFGLDRVVFVGGERTEFDGPLATIHASDSGGADWFPEAFMPPSSIRSMAWAGVPGEGLLLAAAGRSGLWVRDLSVPIVGGVTPPVPTPTRTEGPSPTASAPGTPTGSATAGTVTATATGGATGTAEPIGTGPVSATPTASATEATSTPSPTSTSSTTPVSPTPSAAASLTPESSTETPPPSPSPTASATDTPRTSGRTVFLPIAERPRR